MSRQKMFKIILMVDEPDMKSLLLFFWKLLSFQNRMRTFAPWYWNLSPAARYLTWVFNILMLFESMVYKWILVYIFCLKSIGLSLSDEASKTKFLNHVLKELNNFRYLWKFEPDIPNSFGEILFANPTIYKEWGKSKFDEILELWIFILDYFVSPAFGLIPVSSGSIFCFCAIMLDKET